MIRLTNISKSYSKNQVLTDVNLEVNKGSIIGITGRNGCGKTTLISILAGVESPDSGSIECDSSNIGYVPQINPLIEDLSVKDNLKLWCDTNENFSHFVDTYDFSDILKKKVSKLSGGMKRRLAISCAMVNSPDILLMDEPTASLDIVYKDLIHQVMRDFTAEGGTIVMISHEKDELSMCDRVYILEGGQIRMK